MNTSLIVSVKLTHKFNSYYVIIIILLETVYVCGKRLYTQYFNRYVHVVSCTPRIGRRLGPDGKVSGTMHI